MRIRDAVPYDAPACAAIYAPYVDQTAITFELVPPSDREMGERIAVSQRNWAWLVAEDAGRVVGYAYGAEFKSRAAYRWACEVSVYLACGLRRRGVGRALYAELLPRLAGRGYRTALAGMTLPNDASVGLHAACGFEVVGVYRRVGWKLDAWHDVQFMQRPLAGGTADADDLPAEPV